MHSGQRDYSMCVQNVLSKLHVSLLQSVDFIIPKSFQSFNEILIHLLGCGVETPKVRVLWAQVLEQVPKGQV